MLKICYIGNYEIVQFRDYGKVFFINYNKLNRLNVFDIIQQYDLLVLEINESCMDEIISWIFDLRCKTKIPIFAVLDNCNNRNKLKLDKIGVRDYIDKNLEINKIATKMESMARLISLGKNKMG